MTLYARGDVMCIGVPVTSGGCGDTHSRPVRDGAPVKLWALDCPGCERFLNGDRQVLEFSFRKDKDGHLVTNSQGHAIQEGIRKVQNRDPLWSNNPADLVKTGAEVAGEQQASEDREARKDALEAQGRALNTFTALMQIPGADPVKLARTLGLNLDDLGLGALSEVKPVRRRKPRVVPPPVSALDTEPEPPAEPRVPVPAVRDRHKRKLETYRGLCREQPGCAGDAGARNEAGLPGQPHRSRNAPFAVRTSARNTPYGYPIVTFAVNVTGPQGRGAHDDTIAAWARSLRGPADPNVRTHRGGLDHHPPGG